jgi:hypothetical protein
LADTTGFMPVVTSVSTYIALSPIRSRGEAARSDE